MKDHGKDQNYDLVHAKLVKGAKFSSVLEFPLLKKTSYKPKSAIPFDVARKSKDTKEWIHFYSHDYRYECVWNKPEQYLPLFKRFAGVITPDYSLYWDMPLVQQMWNTYRNRALAYWLQKNGVNIIPNVRWGDERTFDFAFEGLPQGCTIALSTHGSLRDKESRENFKQGLAVAVQKLKPNTIVNYSYTPEDSYKEYIDKGIRLISLKTQIARTHRVKRDE